MPADPYNLPRENQCPSNEQGTCASTLLSFSLLTVYSNLENKRISFLGWEQFQAVLEQGPIISRQYPIQSFCHCHQRLNSSSGGMLVLEVMLPLPTFPSLRLSLITMKR
jgi:hypothetical protein